MKKKRMGSGGAPIKEFAGHCGFAVTGAAVLSLILLAGLAALRAKVDLPFSFHQPAATIIIALSTLAAAYVVGRRRKKTGLMFGAVAGLGVFVLVALVSVIVVGGGVSGQIFTKIIALVSAGGLGGLIGVSRAGRGARRKKIAK